MNNSHDNLSIVGGNIPQIMSLQSFDVMIKLDFVQIFPPELTTKLFTYLGEKDLISCTKCSIAWYEVINDNVQWKLRCIRRGWATKISGANLAQKWNEINSHVCLNMAYKFRKSPKFIHSERACLRISVPCVWAVYFRQCHWILRSWNSGIYVIHRLSRRPNVNCPEYEGSSLNNDFDSNGKLLVVGTSSGRVLLWSVEGVPQFLTSTYLRQKIEVKSVILKSYFLIVLYQSGLINVVLDTRKLVNSENPSEVNLELVYSIRGIGKYSPDRSEFVINAQPIYEDDVKGYVLGTGNEEDKDVEIYIRDLFRVELWMENDTIYDDMGIYANESIVVLTGVNCRCFHWWKLDKGSSSIGQVQLSPGYHVICQCYLTPRKLYLSAQKDDDYGNKMNQPSFVLVYDLATFEENSENSVIPFRRNISNIQAQLVIPVETKVEEIRSDSLDNRIVFITQTGKVCGMELKTDGFEPLFNIATPSTFVDNLTVSDTLIIFRQCDGFIVGMNWSGEPLYEIEAHYGFVKGLQIFEDRILVSGGNAMQLCVWDAKTGNRLHTVFHQPCRIQHLFVDATKIITIGREDPPVVVAYW